MFFYIRLYVGISVGDLSVFSRNVVFFGRRFNYFFRRVERELNFEFRWRVMFDEFEDFVIDVVGKFEGVIGFISSKEEVIVIRVVVDELVIGNSVIVFGFFVR